jgi:hypothetical protein
MTRIRSAKSDDFSVTVNGGLLIFTTVMSKMSFHEPRLGVTRIDVENAVDKNFCDLPTFFGNRACCV